MREAAAGDEIGDGDTGRCRGALRKEREPARELFAPELPDVRPVEEYTPVARREQSTFRIRSAR
jgi:hypothetical protein